MTTKEEFEEAIRMIESACGEANLLFPETYPAVIRSYVAKLEAGNQARFWKANFITTEKQMLSTHDYITTLDELQGGRCELLREEFKKLEATLFAFPESGKRTFSDRCISIARTKLEEACMYAIKAVVFEGKEVGIDPAIYKVKE